jgi:hypothetical protein
MQTDILTSAPLLILPFGYVLRYFKVFLMAFKFPSLDNLLNLAISNLSNSIIQLCYPVIDIFAESYSLHSGESYISG